MPIRLYDTARQRLVPFEPGPTVRMYVCGITPYDSTHLGHAATYLSYDLLIRRLESLGHSVQMVRNITDVDDSILPKARSMGVDFLELAAAETARFHDDMAALDTRAPIAEPRPTQSMGEIIEMIAVLRDRAVTYQSDGFTYFDVTKAPRYGQLSHYSREHMIDLARERGGHPDDPRKRNPLDFVLWQPSLADEPTWDSPFGPGRPGWHIECSAMSKSALGMTLDLHGGGADLIFPHHECEIAQSEAANDAPFVRHWMHTGLVAYQGVKMSKSLGNLVFVSELRKTADPRAIRLALMAHHYREDWEWFDGEIDDASARLERLFAAANSAGAGPDPRAYTTRVHDALDADLDAPRARDALDEWSRGILAGAGVHEQSAGALRDAAALCGIDLDKPLP